MFGIWQNRDWMGENPITTIVLVNKTILSLIIAIEHDESFRDFLVLIEIDWNSCVNTLGNLSRESSSMLIAYIHWLVIMAFRKKCK
jgi:hypothetical protein